MDGSMDDGWMDGWSRPNHMRSHLDALQTLIPVDLRRFPGDLHSVAKQASFETPFFRDPGRFGKVFGGPSGGTNRFLGGFFLMVFSNAFWQRFRMDF